MAEPDSRDLCGGDGLEVLDHGEGVVEVVQQRPPFPERVRVAEALDVGFERFPLDEEEERAGLLDAALDT